MGETGVVVEVGETGVVVEVCETRTGLGHPGYHPGDPKRAR